MEIANVIRHQAPPKPGMRLGQVEAGEVRTTALTQIRSLDIVVTTVGAEQINLPLVAS